MFQNSYRLMQTLLFETPLKQMQSKKPNDRSKKSINTYQPEPIQAEDSRERIRHLEERDQRRYESTLELIRIDREREAVHQLEREEFWRIISFSWRSPGSTDDLPRHHFRSNSTDVEKCPICLQIYENDDVLIGMLCKHEFHESCLSKWFKDYRTCPVCRKEHPRLKAKQSDATSM